MKTPGFARRLEIAFSYDCHGRKVAYYFSRSAGASRCWFRMPIADAVAFVATDCADEVSYVRAVA